MRSMAALSVAPAFASSSIRDSSAEISILFATLERMPCSSYAAFALSSDLICASSSTIDSVNLMRLWRSPNASYRLSRSSHSPLQALLMMSLATRSGATEPSG